MFYRQSGITSNDRILMDDNRELNPDTLNNVKILDKMWFMGLEEDDKFTVLIGMNNGEWRGPHNETTS